MRRLFEQYLDRSCFRVIEGGPSVAATITTRPWNLIVFTGSPEKGRLVARAAAENLVPCILELGGKSPTVVDSDANINVSLLHIVINRLRH
jgi:aldehyde dehydrogenase (NAD+)